LDFHLFGKVKNVLIGREISDEIALLEAVTATNYRLSFATGLNVSRV
jgi:hypothetical protein